MADYARLLIAKIIHDGDLSSPLTSGVMEEWFEDDEHQVFSWMLEYLDRYSQTPTLAAFRHQFPVYKLPPVEEPIDYYIDQFRDQRKRTLLVDAIISADDALKQGDSNSAESRLSHGLSQIQQEMAALTASEDRWPVLNEAALYGLPGEVVALFDPHTEADPVAILTTFLAMFGAMAASVVGEAPHAMAESAIHPGRIYPLQVGDTSRARKGSALQNMRRLFNLVDADFMASQVRSGFGSGEALIHYVSDAPDKRTILWVPEFARLLTIANSWTMSTLSPIVRQAWDGDMLEHRTQKQVLVAENAHLVIIGQITEEELKARLTNTEIFSGFLNRFLPFCVTRSKLLPSGGNLEDSEIKRLARRINRTLTKVQDYGRMYRSPAAEKRWEWCYERIAEDEAVGLLGAATARAEAQVLRLSVLYALTDGSSTIEVPHLKAAWFLWRYSRDSAAYLFGDSVGSEVADTIIAALRRSGDSGLSRTEISALLGRHKSKKEIDVALEILASRRLIAPVTKGKRKPNEERFRATN